MSQKPQAMTKTFPKSRICVIDIYPAFEQGMKTAIEFAEKHNLSLNSLDGRKIILGFMLRSIETTFKNTSSAFPKVLCMSKKNLNKRVKPFVDTYFEGMMKYVPFPYCGVYDLTCPELEMAAESSLRSQKTRQKFDGFVKKNRIKVA
jgi:hypothetical protein